MSSRPDFPPIAAAVAWALILASAAGCGTAPDPVGAVSSTPQPSPTKINGMGAIQRPSPAVPCKGADHAPVDLLWARAAAAGIAVYLPKTGGPPVDDAWTCWGIPQPVVMIGELQVGYEDGWNPATAVQHLTHLAADDGGTVSSIQGYPALVSPAAEPGSYHAILIVRGTTAIEILARPTVEFQRLVDLANDLDLTKPVVPIPTS